MRSDIVFVGIFHDRGPSPRSIHKIKSAMLEGILCVQGDRVTYKISRVLLIRTFSVLRVLYS
jgi:hypothetical protein